MLSTISNIFRLQLLRADIPDYLFQTNEQRVISAFSLPFFFLPMRTWMNERINKWIHGNKNGTENLYIQTYNPATVFRKFWFVWTHGLSKKNMVCDFTLTLTFVVRYKNCTHLPNSISMMVELAKNRVVWFQKRPTKNQRKMFHFHYLKPHAQNKN